MLKDTIISAFNYDGTLLKWLKKVEEALQGDTLTNIEVVTNSDYSMQLKLTFGDNTFIMSPVFTNKGRGIVSITKTATSGLVDTYTVTYTDNTTSTFTVTNAEGFNANNLYNTLTAGTGIELTNDGQHVTVTAKRLLNEIVDSQGRQRFIEGEGYLTVPTGMTITYNKWSLSGTHLMLVIAGEVTNELPAGQINGLVIYTSLPRWVKRKIIPINIDRVIINDCLIVLDNYSTITRKAAFLMGNPETDNPVISIISGEVPSMHGGFRIEFDLLIDTD